MRIEKTVERVKELKEGKTYNIYYKGKLALNITLEDGVDMSLWLALEIMNDMLRQHKMTKVRAIEDISYEEAELDFS